MTWIWFKFFLSKWKKLPFWSIVVSMMFNKPTKVNLETFHLTIEAKKLIITQAIIYIWNESIFDFIVNKSYSTPPYFAPLNLIKSPRWWFQSEGVNWPMPEAGYRVISPKYSLSSIT